MKNKLFIGITSWNSELFLDCCLSAVAKTTKGLNKEIVVFDNCSEDQSGDIALSHGAKLITKNVSQAEALNQLLAMSNAQFTLLIHSDTILLSNNWFDHCCNLINDKVVLVSPEDIGCGPMTRSFGKGMPESSFLFFNTKEAKKLKTWHVTKRRFGIPLRIEKKLDLYGEHVTHNIPKIIKKAQKEWRSMSVLHSNILLETIYKPKHHSKNWVELLGRLEYGLGNFYMIDGELTHYHNWYDRISSRTYDENNPTTQKNNDGFEVDYIHQYSMKFIEDFRSGTVNLPIKE